jgi:hypothetical protein
MHYTLHFVQKLTAWNMCNTLYSPYHLHNNQQLGYFQHCIHTGMRCKCIKWACNCDIYCMKIMYWHTAASCKFHRLCNIYHTLYKSYSGWDLWHTRYIFFYMFPSVHLWSPSRKCLHCTWRHQSVWIDATHIESSHVFIWAHWSRAKRLIDGLFNDPVSSA